jgi:glucan phosphoethanolaminetransferase (alkaline phosphatase superfamily)
MPFPTAQLVPLIIATSFAAGLNVYATVATLGLLGRFQAVQLPSNLHVLQDWWVIAIAAALFVIELFADKIPYFDLVWNALHTFIRVPVAAVIAYAASSNLSPEWHIASVALASGVALAAHSGKTALRIGITPSPEPFSNIALSASEDILAIFLTWLATKHPYVAAAIAIVLIVLLVLAIRWIWRMLRKTYRRLMAGPSGAESSITS